MSRLLCNLLDVQIVLILLHGGDVQICLFEERIQILYKILVEIVVWNDHCERVQDGKVAGF